MVVEWLQEHMQISGYMDCGTSCAAHLIYVIACAFVVATFMERDASSSCMRAHSAVNITGSCGKLPKVC